LTWDAVAAIAESVGAVAVVFSMLVLAHQIRESNRNAKAEAIRARGERMVDVWWRTAESERLTLLVHHAFFEERPLEELPPADQSAFHALARSLMMMWESEYLENRHGALDDDVWDRRLNSIGSMTLKPAYNRIWNDIRPILTAGFVAEVERVRASLLAASPARTRRSDSVETD
jgi:hypothetical protein